MCRSLFVLVVALVAAHALKAADAPAVELRKKLTAKGDLSVENQTFEELLETLKSKLRTEVVYDQQALFAAGYDIQAPMFHSKKRGGTLGESISATLAAHKLHCANIAGTLVIGFETEVISRQLRQRVSVDGESTAISSLLSSLADKTGANIVFDPRLDAKTTGAAVKLPLHDVPVETAVRLTAEVAGLSAVRMNNVLFVTTDERAAKLLTVSDPPTSAAEPPASPFIGFGGPPLKPPGR